MKHMRQSRTKPVTFTIPQKLDAILHAQIGRGKISSFVTKALWDALQKEEDLLLKEFLEADKDPGNIEAKSGFAEMEGEDFFCMKDFDFHEDINEK